MAEGTLAIKLRCASWPQLATIYKRDLSQGTMFLRAATPPPLGTQIRIDLTLPSATVIALSGVVHSHVNDPQRGSGVELKLAPIPTDSVWLIESALASERSKRRAGTVEGSQMSGMSTVSAVAAMSGAHSLAAAIPSITEGAEVTAAERDLIKALTAEAESLKKLNPFLVLGVGYEATDGEVRAAFGELTKRYHPDRFARYESDELRQVAAEIFILIRDAYRRLGDAVARAQVLHALGRPASAPRAIPGPPRPPPTSPPPRLSPQRLPPPPPPPGAQTAPPAGAAPPAAAAPSFSPIATAATTPIPVIRPPAPAQTPPIAPAARGSAPRHPGAPPAASVPPVPPAPPSPPSPSVPPAITSGPPARRAATDPGANRRLQSQPIPVVSGPPAEPVDTTALEALLDDGKLDEAHAAYRLAAKKHPGDRNLRAGVELCEGLLALVARDRLEAAQRFEAALEIDPSNERAARELADMRRQATNERKGLLSRLMGKKEPGT